LTKNEQDHFLQRHETKVYDVFLSYAHTDAKVAIRIQRRLEEYIPPENIDSRKSLKVFRDESDLSASPSLTAALRSALLSSQFLVLLCSPSAAASKYVDLETQIFIQSKGTNRVLLVLLDGMPEDAVPKSLQTIKGDSPVFVDLRKMVSTGWRKRRLFSRETLRLIAGLLEVPLDELLHREHLRQRKQRHKRIAFTLLFLLVIFLLLLLTNLRREPVVVHHSRDTADENLYYGGVSCLDFSETSNLLAIGTNGGMASLWDLSLSTSTPGTLAQVGTIRSIEINGNPNSVVLTTGSSILELNRESESIIRRKLDLGRQLCSQVKYAKGNIWAVGGQEGYCALVDLERKRTIKEYDAGNDMIKALWLLASDSTILAYTRSGDFIQIGISSGIHKPIFSTDKEHIEFLGYILPI